MRILELYERVLPSVTKDAILMGDNGVLQEFNNMTLKSEVLKKHKNSIWQGTGKDKRWKTTIANNQVIAKNTERELFDYLADYYLIPKSKKVTLASLYPEWTEYKSYHTRSKNYFGRIDNDWRKYYLNTEIIDIPISSLTKLKLDEWSHRLIRNNQLTSKQYYNMATIMKQMLTFAVDKEIIPSNPFLDIKIDTKLFVTKKKPASQTQVFLIDELKQLKEAAYQEYETTKEISALAIIICSMTGVRAGELVALKEEDIGDVYLHIERMETKVERQKDDGKWERCGYEVVDYTKSKAGTRDVYMPEEVRQLFSIIIQRNHEMGLEDFIFFNSNNERMHESSLDKKIYKLCTKLGIPPKSVHKLRKTYISQLLDEGVNVNTVREIVGHEDERTTYKNYCFDRRSKTQIEAQLEKILGCK